jgi:hypothetical protein
MASPVDGGSVSVIIDGVAVGSPGSWGNRPDLDALFPSAVYPGVVHALGVYPFDPSVYADGIHTIAWGVTTSDQQSDGIGSRYFNVASGSASMTSVRRGAGAIETPAARSAGRDLGRRALDVSMLDLHTAIAAGHGYRTLPALRKVEPDAAGRRVVFGHEIERVVIDASPAGAATYDAYSLVEGELRALPAGASFDSNRGILYWQPGVGYIGDYDFLIVADGVKRIPLRIVLQPQRRRARPENKAWSFTFAATEQPMAGQGS